MPFSARDIGQMKAAHTSARDHYKGGVKSCNKIYKNAGEDKRKQTRNENAIIFFESWNELDRQFDVAFQKQFSKKPEDTSPYYSGMQRVSGDRSLDDIDMENATVANGGFTQGNCLDMSETVVYYCLRHRIPLENVWIGSALAREIRNIEGEEILRPTADHAFVAVTAAGSAPSVDSIFTMMTLPENSVWILDCWMNVVCDARDYRRRIGEQLGKWKKDGKIVLLQPEALAKRFQDELDELMATSDGESAELERVALRRAIVALDLDSFNHELYASRLTRARVTWERAL